MLSLIFKFQHHQERQWVGYLTKSVLTFKTEEGTTTGEINLVLEKRQEKREVKLIVEEGLEKTEANLIFEEGREKVEANLILEGYGEDKREEMRNDFENLLFKCSDDVQEELGSK